MPKGYLKVIEKVPVQFVRRGGDWVQEGGNNTLIVMGTDRAVPEGPATIDDGLGSVDSEGGGKGTGTVIIVAGRKDMAGGNPDINADDTTFYISQLTDVDNNLGTTFESTDKGPSAVLVSDFIRFVFRQNMKISSAVSATYAFLDGDHLHVDMQGKATVALDIDGDSSSCKIDVQNNFIEIKSDGTITITSKDKVVVNAENSVEVNCKTATVNAETSVTVDSPDTTITKKLHVGGAADFASTVDITGLTQITNNLNVAMVAAVGGITGPSGAPIPGGLKTDGDVKGSGDVISSGGTLNMHVHLIPGAKAGPDVVTALNIGGSAALASDIAAKKAAEEAAAKKAAEEAAAAQAAADAAAAAIAAGESQPPPDYGGGG